MGTFIAGNLRTGQILIPNLPVAAGSATITVGAAGSLTCQVPLPMVDPYTGLTVPLVDIISGFRSFIAYEETVNVLDPATGRPTGQTVSKVIQGGPILNDSWDNDAGMLTFNVAGMRAMLNYRLLVPLLRDWLSTDLPGDGDYSITNVTLEGLAIQLINAAVDAVGGKLPIDIPAAAVGTNYRNYPINSLATIGKLLDDLQGVQNGPDLAMRPYRSDASHIRWATLTGTPLVQPGAAHVFDTTVPVPNARALKIDRDFTVMANVAYGLANGSGSSGTVATGTSTSATPATTQAKSIDYSTMGAQVNHLFDPNSTTLSRFVAIGTGSIALDVARIMATLAVGAAGTTGVGPTALVVGTDLKANTQYTFSAEVTTGTGPAMALAASGTGVVANVTGTASTITTAQRISVTFTTGASGTVTLAAVNAATATAGQIVYVGKWTCTKGLVTDFISGDQTSTDVYEYEWDGTANAGRSVRTDATQYPRLEAGASEDVDTVVALQQKTDGVVQTGKLVMETWSLEVRKESQPDITTLAEGDLATVVIGTTNPRKAAGPYSQRILSVTTTHDQPFAKISMAPVRT